MTSFRPLALLAFVTFGPLACAATDEPTAGANDDLRTSSEDAQKAPCDRSAYNCRVPNFEHHSDPNRKWNDFDDTYFWGVDGQPALRDGANHVRGHVVSTEGHKGAVKLDFGERKTLGGVVHVYAFSAKLDTGESASGWIREDAIVRENTVKEMPTIAPREPSEGTYEETFVITGGDLASDHENLALNVRYGDLRVNPSIKSGEHASDYLVREWNPEAGTGFVNFLFNLPDSGGVTTDTLPMCTEFKRYKGVDELTTKLYFTDSKSESKLDLHFVFGEIDGRRGWITHEMLTLKSDLDKLDAKHPCRPKAAPAKPAPPPTTPAAPAPTVACHVVCCESGAGTSDQTAASDDACIDDAQTFCAASGHVQSASANGSSIYDRDGSTADLRCWAKCANRADYHEVTGVTDDCDGHAKDYCGESDRGALEDAAWNRCDPSLTPTQVGVFSADTRWKSATKLLRSRRSRAGRCAAGTRSPST